MCIRRSNMIMNCSSIQTKWVVGIRFKNNRRTHKWTQTLARFYSNDSVSNRHKKWKLSNKLNKFLHETTMDRMYHKFSRFKVIPNYYVVTNYTAFSRTTEITNISFRLDLVRSVARLLNITTRLTHFYAASNSIETSQFWPWLVGLLWFLN